MTSILEKFVLTEKTAFVCGGAGLIGAESAKALASAGAKVIVLDIERTKGARLVNQIRKDGFEAEFEFFDSSRLEKTEESLNNLLAKYGPAHIWVDAAYPRTKDWSDSIESLNLKSLQKNVDVQLNAGLWMSRHMALAMKKKKIKGSIICFGSIYGVQANDFTVYPKGKAKAPYAYSAIKAGVINATRYIASCFGEFGIRANTVCPGGIYDRQDKQFVRNYSNKTPLGRMGSADDIAGAVLFLASDASSYVTGHALMVDGGWTIV